MTNLGVHETPTLNIAYIEHACSPEHGCLPMRAHSECQSKCFSQWTKACWKVRCQVASTWWAGNAHGPGWMA